MYSTQGRKILSFDPVWLGPSSSHPYNMDQKENI